ASPGADERGHRDRGVGRARRAVAHRDPGHERGRRADGAPLSARRGTGAEGVTAISDLVRDAQMRGWITAPGFIDLHAHLREPGFEEAETVATGARAALLGGFTTIC